MPVEQMILTASAAAGAVVLASTAIVSLASRREGQPRAASRSLLLGVMLAVPFLVAGLLPFPGRVPVAAALLVLAAGGVLLLLLPLGRAGRTDDDRPTTRFDERDVMFARAMLQPGTERFAEYYRRHPDKRVLDDRFRLQPGLLSSQAPLAEPIAFAAAAASFETVAAFHPLLERGPSPVTPLTVDPARMSAHIQRWGMLLGAVAVGITELRQEHLYSTIGRGERYGQPVMSEHRHAIALAVEMDEAAVACAPHAPALMESARQYLRSGAIAVQLAEMIHGLGYAARAHIDGCYRVICPLVARDAGLGEIGRMGLLMTPRLGPRVRLAVVTTDLPLVSSPAGRDPAVLDFCTRCRKCAEVCPAGAIPRGDRTRIEGALRWRIDSEACFTYWCKIGTDCGRCMSVCPYAHADNLLHNIVRFGVRRSGLVRRLAVVMDDVLYGRKPPSRRVPGWMRPDRS